jgi:hypothetical protein
VPATRPFFTGNNTISVADLGGTAEQLTLSVSHGTLAFGAPTGLTVSGNDTASIVVNGSVTALDADLLSLSYTPTLGYTGSDTLSLSDKDSSDNVTATASVVITVNVPPPPVVTAPPSAILAENASLTNCFSRSVTARSRWPPRAGLRSAREPTIPHR